MYERDYHNVDSLIGTLDPDRYEDVEAVAAALVRRGSPEDFGDLIMRAARMAGLRDRAQARDTVSPLALGTRRPPGRGAAREAPERSRQLWTALADNSNPQLRAFVAADVGSLVLPDRVLGLACWAQLLRDPNRDVRDTADDRLEGIVAETLDSGTLHELRTNYGLKWSDVAQLRDAFARAEQGDVRTVPSDILGSLANAGVATT